MVNANVISALSPARCPVSAILLLNAHCTLHKIWTCTGQQIHKKCDRILMENICKAVNG